MWRFLAVHSFNRPFVFTGDVLPPNSSCSFRFFNMFLYVSVSFGWSLQYIQCLISRSLAHPESWKSYMCLSVWHRCPQAPVTGFFHFWAPNLTTAYNCPAKTKLGLNLVSRVESPAFQFFSGVNPVVFPPHQLRSHLSRSPLRWQLVPSVPSGSRPVETKAEDHI